MPMPVHSFHNHRFSFEEGELAGHKNLMTCVIIGNQHPVVVSDGCDLVTAQIICIKADVSHRVAVPKGGADIIYLDGVRLGTDRAPFMPLTSEWRGLARAFDLQDYAALNTFRSRLEQDRLPPDQSVLEIVNELYLAPFTRLSQTDLASALGLERTQALRHFKATTGQTFRRFKIWAALVAATRSAHAGERIGHAGIEAGFADAAHLARTAGIVFGVTPSVGLSGLKAIETM
jgi:AraC-like DNA-binding protein